MFLVSSWFNAVSSLSVQGFTWGILGPWLGHRLSSCLFSVFSGNSVDDVNVALLSWL